MYLLPTVIFKNQPLKRDKIGKKGIKNLFGRIFLKISINALNLDYIVQVPARFPDKGEKYRL